MIGGGQALKNIFSGPAAAVWPRSLHLLPFLSGKYDANKIRTSGKSGAKMINAAFAREFTSLCKTTDVNAALTKFAA